MFAFLPKCRNLLGIFAIVLTTSGCQALLDWNSSSKFGVPNFQKPGTAKEQQSRAIRFDPYAEEGVGPQTEGLRPREYSKPLAEPLRARWPIVE
ncbi:MAG: hypothetical protein PVH19_13495 [Planctomycetia bacterium]|jgi:hypothetical protein